MMNLSTRELEVLKLISTEHNNNQIAKQLSISPHTVDSHRRKIMFKLGAKNTAGLITKAFQSGILIVNQHLGIMV